MSVRTKIESTILIVLLLLSISIGLQLLGWHGPQWVMTEMGDKLLLSPAIFGPCILVDIGLLFGTICIWASETK